MAERIYLAGKISEEDWRRTITTCIDTRYDEGLRSDTYDLFEFPWPTVEGAIFGEHSYTGPFFLNCDHGCGHGPNSHGSGIQSVTCFVDSPSSLKETYIQELCLDAIRRSTLVFAWIDSESAYGTLVEIGYAVGRGIPVYISYPGDFEGVKDLWFARSMATQCFQCVSPQVALESLLHVLGYRTPRWQRIAGECDL